MFAELPAEEAPGPSGVFAQREQYLIKREAEGELAFVYVENDGTPEHSMWCARPLPALPSICRASLESHWQDSSISMECSSWLRDSRAPVHAGRQVAVQSLGEAMSRNTAGVQAVLRGVVHARARAGWWA